jgi:hypothetical protein
VGVGVGVGGQGREAWGHGGEAGPA